MDTLLNISNFISHRNRKTVVTEIPKKEKEEEEERKKRKKKKLEDG